MQLSTKTPCQQNNFAESTKFFPFHLQRSFVCWLWSTVQVEEQEQHVLKTRGKERRQCNDKPEAHKTQHLRLGYTVTHFLLHITALTPYPMGTTINPPHPLVFHSNPLRPRAFSIQPPCLDTRSVTICISWEQAKA